MPTPIKRDSSKTSTSQPLSGKPRHGEMRSVKVPAAKREWCVEAKAWYNSLKTSGQSDYFQNSDWQLARICGDLLTYVYKEKFVKCTMMIVEISSIMDKLGTSEGARRQTMRVELDLPVPVEQTEEQKYADVYANALGKKK